MKNGSQWSSNYNLSSLEINGPSPPAEEEFFSPSSSKQETVGSSNEFLLFFKIGIRKDICGKKFYVNNQIIKLFEKKKSKKILISCEAKS